jgi:hypothetical protein
MPTIMDGFDPATLLTGVIRCDGRLTRPTLGLQPDSWVGRHRDPMAPRRTHCRQRQAG